MLNAIKNIFMLINWQRTIFIFLIIACLISALTTSFFVFTFISTRNAIIDNAKAQAAQQTKIAAQEINDFLILLQPIVQGISQDLSKGLVAKDKIVERLQAKAVNITGIGIAYSPYAYDKNIKLYAPYYVERDGKQQLVQLETFYDYTLPEYARYHKPLEVGPTFQEPFFDPASATILAEYGAPFFDTNNNKIGVVFANHSTEHIDHVIKGLNLGYKGYGFVLSKNGIFVAHPIEEYTRDLRSIFDVATELKNPQLAEIAQQATTGKSGYIDHEDPATGQQSWIFFEPIAANGWTMGSVFIKDELDLNTKDLERTMIKIILSLIAFFITFFLLLFKVYTGEEKSLWRSSLATSFFLLTGIIFMWYIAHIAIRYQIETGDSIIIQDPTSLTRFLQTVTNQSEKTQQPTATNEQTPTHSKHSHHSTMITTPVTTTENNPLQPIKSDKNHSSMHHHIDIFTHSHTSSESLPANLIEQTLQKISDNIIQAQTLLNQPTVSAPQKTTDTSSTTSRTETSPHPPQKSQAHNQDHTQDVLTDEQKNQPIMQSQIPTGVYLQYLEFKGINTIQFIGHFWQRYANTISKTIKKGIIFPLASSIRMENAYTFQEDKETVQGWNVQGEVNQRFNYATYPFDTKLIRIQMWPYDFDKGIILVPDFSAYKVINPSSLPGINPSVKLQEWYMGRSFFSFNKNKYLTNFGNYISGPFGTIDRSTKSETPDLYFNITLRRYIFSSLILDLFPIIVIFAILFLILFLVSQGLIDKIYYVLGTNASLFFTVILAHIRFKSAIPVQQIVFFEFFYFILHFLIIMITIVTVLFFLGVQNPIISYKKLLIPQLLYWPLVTGAILALSIVNFY